MMVAANLGAGVEDLNAPYFNLYLENLPAIESWTRSYMKGRPGACVPETMRFNGKGSEYESSWTPISIGRDCDADFKPYYNSRTISTDAEVSLWIWQQYLATGDRRFLTKNYPIMDSSARFLLAYQKVGDDGLLHTSPSNAHETQWDVTDPMTDIASAKALYTVMIQSAKLLGKDPDRVLELETALPKIPLFPRMPEMGSRTLMPVSADADGHDVIAESYLPGASIHNAENIGLEPVWPYDLIRDKSLMFELVKRTYEHRPYVGVADWSFDPVQAARLGLGDEVRFMLLKVTESSQHSINGFANWDKQYREFYIEQVGVVANALQEALVQDYDGLIRLAPPTTYSSSWLSSVVLVLGVIASLLANSDFVNAQTTGLHTISGTVTDSSGAMVLQANLTITNMATGLSSKNVANGSEYYEVEPLNPGRYEILVSLPGFQDLLHEGITLEADERVCLQWTAKHDYYQFPTRSARAPS